MIGGPQRLREQRAVGPRDYVVVEADESDRSFLKLSPAIAVVTNIDREHMDQLRSWENLQQPSSTSRTKCSSTAR